MNLHDTDYGQAELGFFQKYPNGYVIGVDEAARGTMAGGMYAAAVAIDFAGYKQLKDNVYDSKLTHTPQLRKVLSEKIKSHSMSEIARVDVSDINTGINLDILNRKVMQEALSNLSAKLAASDVAVYCDSTHLPPVYNGKKVEVYTKGERHFVSIAAASILAKSAFDAEVVEMDKKYPKYAFLQHSGYGTPQHLGKIRTLGYLPVHRLTYKSFIGIPRNPNY